MTLTIDALVKADAEMRKAVLASVSPALQAAAAISPALEAAKRMSQYLAEIDGLVRQSLTPAFSISGILNSSSLGFSETLSAFAKQPRVLTLALEAANFARISDSVTPMLEAINLTHRNMLKNSLLPNAFLQMRDADFLRMMVTPEETFEVEVNLPEGPTPAITTRDAEIANRVVREVLVTLLAAAQRARPADVFALLVLLVAVLQLMAMYGYGPMPLPPGSRCLGP